MRAFLTAAMIVAFSFSAHAGDDKRFASIQKQIAKCARAPKYTPGVRYALAMVKVGTDRGRLKSITLESYKPRTEGGRYVAEKLMREVKRCWPAVVINYSGPIIVPIDGTWTDRPL